MTADEALAELERTHANSVPMDIQALACCVLAVAVRRVEGWCAYIDAVPGKKHVDEYLEVMGTGCKLLEDVARAIFPRYNDIPYSR